MPIQNKIRHFIDKRGISVYRFQQETGVAPRTAYDLYNKPDQLPSPSVLRKLCDTYQMQPNAFLEWIPENDDLY